MFIFTNFVPKDDINAVFTMGDSFVLWIAEILISNIAIMFYKIGKSTASQRRKDKIQKQYE